MGENELRLKDQVILSLSLFLVICFLGIGIFYSLHWLPQSAEALFGLPDPEMDFAQKIIYSFRLLASQRQLLSPLTNSSSSKNFYIASGETAGQVVKNLEDAGFIQNANSLRWYLIYKGYANRIQAGEYMLGNDQSAIEIAQMISDTNPQQVKFVILPGMRVEEVAALLPTSGLNIPSQEFLSSVRSPDNLELPDLLNGIKTLEGFLFPGEYFFQRDVQLNEFVLAFLNRFSDSVSEEILQGFKGEGLSLGEGVILASILQREAPVCEERPVVASVFYNRLRLGMKLESDPTVQYALGNSTDSWWKFPLHSEDFVVSSAFNTYLNYGLPPTPICNPDLCSLQSAAYPQASNYLFFRAECEQTGLHKFFENYEDHQKYQCE
jgi:UPF0755 protein